VRRTSALRRAAGYGMSWRKVLIQSLLVLAIAALLIFQFYQGSSGPTASQEQAADRTAALQTQRPALGAPRPLAAGEAVIGGVPRPRSDVAPRHSDQSAQSPQASVAESADASKTSSKAEESEDPFDYGATPPVRGDANVHVQSVVEAIRQNRNPERISALIQPKAFDARAYAENPEAYLNVVEPGRVFQPAQPKEGVPRIRSLSPRLQRVEQGNRVVLRVQAPAAMPVTFTSFDLGRFAENKLTSITVAANARGVAEVNFEATAGTIEDVNILAASPSASGQVKFVVNVSKPGGLAAENR